MRVAADFVLDQKRGCVLSSFIWIILIDFVLRSTGKAMGDTESNREEKLSWT